MTFPWPFPIDPIEDLQNTKIPALKKRYWELLILQLDSLIACVGRRNAGGAGLSGSLKLGSASCVVQEAIVKRLNMR
jgi:hypothetical protein